MPRCRLGLYFVSVCLLPEAGHLPLLGVMQFVKRLLFGEAKPGKLECLGDSLLRLAAKGQKTRWRILVTRSRHLVTRLIVSRESFRSNTKTSLL